MVSTNPNRPSTGQGFESKSSGLTDMSDLVGDPMAGQSMAGGAATTEPSPPFGASGSYSEGTAQVMDAADHGQGDVTQVHTALGSSPGDTDSHFKNKDVH